MSAIRSAPQARQDTAGKLGAYLIVLLILVGIELPFMAITMGLSLVARNRRWVQPYAHGVLDALKVFCGVLIAGWAIRKIGEEPSWLMFIIAGILMIQNDVMRIKRVESGKSKVKRMLEEGGEPEAYDQRLDLGVERGHLVGDIVGWVGGTMIVLEGASLLSSR